jgi:hypothetical protein
MLVERPCMMQSAAVACTALPHQRKPRGVLCKLLSWCHCRLGELYRASSQKWSRSHLPASADKIALSDSGFQSPESSPHAFAAALLAKAAGLLCDLC